MAESCEYCNHEMSGISCMGYFVINGIKFDRTKFGSEENNYGEICGDCSVKKDQIHHVGCNIERCPKCGGQALTCDCGKDYVWKP